MKNSLILSTSDLRYNITINRICLSTILKLCKKAKLNETGGILIGYYSDTQRDAIITNILGPPEDSDHTYGIFVRGIKGLQKLLNYFWYSKRYYLGEWHFHPYALAIPSGIDDDQMITFSKNKSMKCPEPILLIIGGNPISNWHLKAFVYEKNNRHELINLGYLGK